MSTGNGEGKQGPLAGIKVIECSTWAFGPIAGHMLGDLGAEVIKVENPSLPDAARGHHPGGRRRRSPCRTAPARLFEMLNRNKRSISDRL